ncbi:MAG: PfkB family carbohydrate kinase [Bacteroidota bacterium]|jgi:1-phosphofructokinase family hexose kinase
MILTVTINPLLERKLYFSKVHYGKENRAFKEEFAAGGKGINVSRQLNYLGIKNSAFTFMGGNKGKILRSILTQERINYSFVSTKSETRSADLIKDTTEKRITTFFGMNSSITKEESDEFKSKLDKMIQNCSSVVFSGSSPCKETDDIFPYGIELAKKYDKISVLDTYGEHLSSCINSSPTVIHNNIHEIETSLGINLATEQDKIKFLMDLYAKGIKMAFLTESGNPSYTSKYDFHYKIYPPVIDLLDATGSGDAFVAGIIYGLENSLVYYDFIRIATALGSANAAAWDVCSVTNDQMNLYLNNVMVEQIGKKIKLIDDSPTTN